MNLRKTDRAVRRVKALPKNRNASAPRTVYTCGNCDFKTSDAAAAWSHSMGHGPWPDHIGGSKMNLDFRELNRKVGRQA